MTIFRETERSLPQNTGRDLKSRDLDCLVINNLTKNMAEEVQTVRGAFEEGEAAFPGAALRMETHLQLAVRDSRCILGIFRPAFDVKEGEE